MKTCVASVAAMTLALGCTAALPPPALPATVLPANITILQTQPPLAHPPLLPAYETAAEAANRGRADQYDDFRIANKQWYARTAPPKAGQFRAMTEWEPMSEVWTTYSQGMPQDKAVRRMYAEQSVAFAKAGKVRVIVPSTVEAADFSAALLQYGLAQSQIDAKVKFVVLPNNAIWHIDYGPLPLIDKVDKHMAFLDFVYYKNRALDDAIPTRLAQDYFKNLTTYRMPFNFEGGNFQADGLGTCTTSLRALKNTGYSELKVKNLFKQYAGCENTLIMKDITDDGTGHIDMFFKWLGPDSVLISEYVAKLPVNWPGVGPVTVTIADSVAQDISSNFKVPYQQVWADNKQRMDDNAALWSSLTAPNGNKYKVFRLAMMPRYKDEYGDVPRTFVNSTMFNTVNVFPSYTLKSCRDPGGQACTDDVGCPIDSHCAAGKCTVGVTSEGCDELLACSNGLQCVDDPLKQALEAKVYGQWQAALPGWQHIGVRADTIALWSGAIHCITRTIASLPIQKTIADGACVAGTCGCSSGGSGQGCTGSEQCYGPQWLCDCSVCKGMCGNGKACTDDADCSSDGVTIVAGSCAIDAKQGCYGQAPSGGGPASGPCGTVSFEGQCEGAKLSYCDGTVKSQTCSGCCVWDTTNQYYDCKSGTVCSGCANECQAGQGGCSSEATHSWSCVPSGGCWKRSYSYCSGGCNTATSECKSGGGSGSVDKCPTSDAGSGDTGGADAGTTDTAASDVAPDVALPDVAKDVAPDSAAEVGSAADAKDVAAADAKDAAVPSDTADTPLGEVSVIDTAKADVPAVDSQPADEDAVSPADGEAPDVQTAADDTVAVDTARPPRTDAASAVEAKAGNEVAGVGTASDVSTTMGNFSGGSSARSACTAAPQPRGYAALWLLLAALAVARGRRRTA